MAVEKMRFVNIAGRISDMDNFVINTIVPFDIQLENSSNILNTVKGLFPFNDENPYERLNKKVADLINVLDHELAYDPTKTCGLMPVSLLEPEIDGYERQLETIQKISRSLEEVLAHKKEVRKQTVPIKDLDIELDRIFTFKYMKFRFGKMPSESFTKLSEYIETLDTIAYKVSEENHAVYLMYFTPSSQQANIDSLFASLLFERIRISGDVKGKPKIALQKLNEEIEDLENRIAMIKRDAKGFVERNFDRLQELYNFTIQLNEVFEVRRFAVRSHDAFYITGWIPKSQADDFREMVDKLKNISCIMEDDEVIIKSSPPTKLDNNKFFKPFEELIHMYGTPSYHELDPTTFVAITYMLFFGLMFGDLGQGIIIALLGFGIYRKTKNNYAQLAIYLGCLSMITGTIYGSFFGNEEILRELFPFVPMIAPMENKMIVLLSAIALGMVLIIMALILNIINQYRNKRYAKLFFDRNGLVGLIMYIGIASIALSVVQGQEASLPVIAIFIIVPIIIIFLSHPIQNMFNKKKYIFPQEGGFIVEATFELIETLLSVASNTISFIRIGAFALNHVGFFMAFHALADIVGGSGSIIVMIIGNILIIVLEGLIVAIQGLRLQYYELFSRYFEGEGIVFEPFKIKG